MEYKHVPVMLKEVLEYLRPKKNEYFIDGTLGGGGYTEALAKAVGLKGKILAIDLDEEALKNTAKKDLANVILINDNFRNLSEIIKNYFTEETLFDGFVVDLGLSSFQLSDERRGFSFRENAPLDMSFGSDGSSVKTKKIINLYSEKELARIFFEYGEEKNSKQIAKAIIANREIKPIETTGELAEIIKKAIPRRFWKERIHPATKTFQALRIETNQELASLKEVLPAALKALKPGGRLAIVSFHSLEDRIVKDFFKENARGCICPPTLPLCRCNHRATLKIITTKPLIATEEEVKNNTRSRSAKLRIAEKMTP